MYHRQNDLAYVINRVGFGDEEIEILERVFVYRSLCILVQAEIGTTAFDFTCTAQYKYIFNMWMYQNVKDLESS